MNKTEVILHCPVMTETMKTEWAINRITVSVIIETLNLKGTEMVSIITFILTFLVKFYISLCISLFIINSSFLLLQTIQFRTLFLFIQWIRTPYLITINRDLLISVWIHHRLLLTMNISHYRLYQKMQTHLISPVKIELNWSTISEIEEDTDLTILSLSILSSLKCTMTELKKVNTKTIRTTTMITTNFSRKTAEQITPLMKTELLMKSMTNLFWESVRMLMSIML